VAAVVFNSKQDHVLMVYETRGNGVTKWKLVTETVEFGELPILAAIRGVKEETNVDVVKDSLWCVGGMAGTKSRWAGYSDTTTCFVLFAKDEQQVAEADGVEVRKATWIPVSTIQKIKAAADEEANADVFMRDVKYGDWWSNSGVQWICKALKPEAMSRVKVVDNKSMYYL
jgi:ADP-ribose pyrophosphatase YjhB (NUDIX family)